MQIAMIHCGDSPHPAHQGFAEAIDAELYGLNKFPIDCISDTIPVEISNGIFADEYDLVIAEGTRSLYGTVAGQLMNETPLIYLAGDQSLYELQTRNDNEQSLMNQLISQHGMTTLRKILNCYIDGVIANSNFTAEFTGKILNVPLRVATPYIQPDLYKHLSDIDPELDQKVAITVGSYAWYKGQDLLSDVWIRVREEHPDAELYLVGSGYPERLGDTPGITVCGYVEDLIEVVSTASLYVHPARAESFGVSVVESLRAGLPAVVTTTTGSKSAVRNVDEDMIVDCSTEALATSIIEYFDQPITERQLRSQTAREQGARFDSKSQKAAFRDEFENLLAEIDSRSLP